LRGWDENYKRGEVGWRNRYDKKVTALKEKRNALAVLKRRC